jgi:type II secretory pathway pseudopilin PulG
MRTRQRGFTLLEVALAVITMGVILVAIMVAHNQSATRVTAADAAFMDTAVSALFKYAKRNNRLPCPDLNGDGMEDAINGVCIDAATKAGGIPYLTIGMTLSQPVGTGLDRKFVYGVYRGGGDANKDLTRSYERSIPPHVPPNVSYMNLDDFKQGVINAVAATTTVNASEIYVTGNDSNSGASDCSNNKLANVAFVVAFAGDRNADGIGSDFDGAHLVNMGWNWGGDTQWNSVKGNTCFVGPGKASTPTYDDQVRAVGFTELLGELSR